MIILGLVLVLCQFWFERLYKDRLLIFFVVAFALLACGMFAWSDKLPLAVQRSLSFLPLRIDPSARLDAEGTLEWRLQMWKTLLPEVPKYLFLGKGFAYSGTDYYLTQEAVRRGIYTSYEDTLVNGNYHQGLLTLIIPFGIWGAIGLMWFWAAGLRVLYSNYRHGLSELQAINTFLISFFVARLIFYVLFYGQYDLDLCQFTGVVGMSIALNQGVRTGKSIAGEAGQTAPI